MANGVVHELGLDPLEEWAFLIALLGDPELIAATRALLSGLPHVSDDAAVQVSWNGTVTGGVLRLRHARAAVHHAFEVDVRPLTRPEVDALPDLSRRDLPYPLPDAWTVPLGTTTQRWRLHNCALSYARLAAR
jgi:hypothetical protein